ncbi:MAG: TRAP-T-associated universal stress protein TeaD [Myxococcota bacterium]|nr:TRAP-T-associated universal stress protein TeaD [Myxococcota bacterium]
MKIQKILVPVDFSANSRPAIDAAISLAQQTGGSVTLVHVSEIPALIGGGPLSAEVPATFNYAAVRKAVLEQVERQFKELTASLGVPVETVTKEGVPFNEIIHTAESIGADLIVMGTHGYTGFKHLLIGSVAEKVVRGSPIPVLTIRPQAAAKGQ